MYPSRPCENNGKSTENDGNNTSCCSDKRVVCAHREKTQAAKQCINLSPCLWRCTNITCRREGQNSAGQSSASRNIIPSPKSQGIPDLHEPPETATAKLHGSGSCGNNTSCSSDKGSVPTRSVGGGEGGSTPCVTFHLVVAPLRGPGRSPVLPFACCVGSLLSVGRCGRCSCWCCFRVRGAQ